MVPSCQSRRAWPCPTPGRRRQAAAPVVTWQPHRIDPDPGGNGERTTERTRQHMTGHVPGMAELLLVRHGESQGNVAATLAHQSGAHVIRCPGARRRRRAVRHRARAGAGPGPAARRVPGGPARRRLVLARISGRGRRRNSPSRPGGWQTPVLARRAAARPRARHPGHAHLGRGGGPAPRGSGAAAVARQVLLPARRAASRGPTSCCGCAPCSPTWTAGIPAQRRPAGLPRRRDPADPLHPGGADGAANCWTSPPRPPSSTPPSAASSGRTAPGPWQLESFNMADHLMSEGVPVTEHAGDANVHPR